MAISASEALCLMKEVRKHYPTTFKWALKKAKCKDISFWAVFMDYHKHIKEMMREEKENAVD